MAARPRPHLVRLADSLHSLSPGHGRVARATTTPDTDRNSRLARIGLRRRSPLRGVTVFDRDMLAVEAGSDPAR